MGCTYVCGFNFACRCVHESMILTRRLKDLGHLFGEFPLKQISLNDMLKKSDV